MRKVATNYVAIMSSGFNGESHTMALAALVGGGWWSGETERTAGN